jgi:hypothetical protein
MSALQFLVVLVLCGSCGVVFSSNHRSFNAQAVVTTLRTCLPNKPTKLFACTQIRARDTRLGGWLKPVVGVCQIDIAHKIPWCEDTYIPPATDIFFQPEAAGVIEGVPGNDPGDKVADCCCFAVWLLLFDTIIVL